MKMKSMVLFAVAIGLGLFAMLSVQKLMSQNNTGSRVRPGAGGGHGHCAGRAVG